MAGTSIRALMEGTGKGIAGRAVSAGVGGLVGYGGAALADYANKKSGWVASHWYGQPLVLIGAAFVAQWRSYRAAGQMLAGAAGALAYVHKRLQDYADGKIPFPFQQYAPTALGNAAPAALGQGATKGLHGFGDYDSAGIHIGSSGPTGY